MAKTTTIERETASGAVSDRKSAKPSRVSAFAGEAAVEAGAAAFRRQQMIAAAAYLRAERRRFVPGAEWEDWLQAEAEVDAQLAKSVEALIPLDDAVQAPRGPAI